MSRPLETLFEMYVQDFDIIFEYDTHPIDLFCKQHTVEEQRHRLQDMRKPCDDLIKRDNKSRIGVCAGGKSFVASETAKALQRLSGIRIEARP